MLWFLAAGQAEAVTVNSQITAKIFGQRVAQDTAAGIRVLNDNFQTVRGSDLGAMAVYKGRIWFLLGDTLYGGGGFDGNTRNFMMAYSKPLNQINKDLGIELEGYVGGGPTRLMTSSGYFIPNALFTINLNGQEHLFAHYMEVIEVAGNDHHIHRSGIVKYNETTKRFDKYKDQAYKWEGSWRHFGMASFWVDYTSGYIYMMGSPSGRFGGVKLAKMTLSRFMDTNNNQGWEYFLGNSWSSPTNDFNVISSAVWMIPPKDPSWSITKDDWENYSWEKQAQMMTIGEFSITYNSYLNKYLLLTGKNFDSTLKGGVYYYSADNIWGPWSQEMLLTSSKINGYEWEPYGIYTTSDLNSNNGQTIYYVGTSWGTGFPPTNYGIYWYKTDFTQTGELKMECSFWCNAQNSAYLGKCTDTEVNSCSSLLPGGTETNKQYCVKRKTQFVAGPETPAYCSDANQKCHCYSVVTSQCPSGQVCGHNDACDQSSCYALPTLTPTETPMTPTVLPTNEPTIKVIEGDASGDGLINLEDLGIWKAEYILSEGTKSDFDDNGKVDLTDLGIWKTEYLK